MIAWTLTHARATMEMLGHIPDFFSDTDPRPAREQLEVRYGGGWHSIPGCFFSDKALCYPDDNPMPLLAEAKLHDETLRFYGDGWLAIIQSDSSFEVSRID